jgi:hypothetical protein
MDARTSDPITESPMPPNSLSLTLDLERLRAESVTWRLLCAAHAPLIVGVLGTHLGGEQRRLPAADLYELIDADLDELRAVGASDLPKSAQGYCADWRTAGFLVRRASEETRGETFELSPGALVGIRMLGELSTPRQTATESRLASIAGQLSQLALDTDPDSNRRLEQLYAQRDQIDDRIERIQAGEVAVIDRARAVERMRDIVAQASEIPSDFARVRSEFDDLNRILRQRIVESDSAQRHVLDEIFHGVDHIADSDEGRTFAAFSSLVMDPSLSAVFDADVDRLLERDFVSSLTLEQRRFLRRFLMNLKELSGEVHDVVTTFARGLRRYVQSQEFHRDRVLRDLLRATLAEGVAAAAATKPYSPTRLDLALSSVEVGSVGSIRLHNPAEFDASAPIETMANDEVDIVALRLLARDTEIDFGELIGHVNLVLDDSARASVGDVLHRFPATQGVASVVGLISLADAQGVRLETTETVRWVNAAGLPQRALVPGYCFTGRIR